MSTTTRAGGGAQPSRLVQPARRLIKKVRINPTDPAPALRPEGEPPESQDVTPQPSKAATTEKAGSNWREDGSYIVGKGQTPVHTRWQKGQSGNPRGKKKGTPNTDTIIIDLMEMPITVKTANGEKRMSRKAALFQRMWEMAAKGDLKAAKFLFDRYGEAQARKSEREVAEETLSEADRGEVESFIAALRFGTDDTGSGELS